MTWPSGYPVSFVIFFPDPLPGQTIRDVEVRNAMKPSEEEPTVVLAGRTARLRPDLVPLYALAAAVLCAAGGWYLLKELAPLLRPLVLAVFLAYTILPAHRALRRWVPAKLSGPLLALLVAAVVLGLAVVIYGNLVDLKSELPRPDRARPRADRTTPHLGPGPLARLAPRSHPGHGSSRGGDDRAAQGRSPPAW